MKSTAENHLAELIALPSVNPRLAAAGDPRAGEARVTDWLVQFCTAAGWPWARQPVHAGRDNFLALVPGGGGETILWEAHQDTVAVEGMTVDPFAATIQEGRIYGRGACDVKGGLAAMLAALAHVADDPSPTRPSILLAATVNEECGFTGARALAEIWSAPCDPKSASPDVAAIPIVEAGGLTLDELRRRRPAAAIVAEPTSLDVVAAHRGVVRWRSTAYGRAAHSSRPERGANAIYAMAGLVRAIERFEREVLAARPADRDCGPPTVSVTTFHGGTGANTIPDRATIDVDRRLAPGESPEAAYGELVAFATSSCDATGCRIEHEPPWMQSRGLSGDDNRAWAERLAAIARSVGRDCRIGGVPYGTNAACFAAAGIPVVVIGPGSIEQAHTADEWISQEQLAAAVDVYARIARGEA